MVKFNFQFQGMVLSALAFSGIPSTIHAFEEIKANGDILNQIKTDLNITSPGFDKQWYLMNQDEPGHDINVVPVWKQGFTGKGVTIAIVDSSPLDHEHLDLSAKYSSEASYSFVDPSSRTQNSVENGTHATRCAGVAAGGRHGLCGVGVAYDVRLSGIQLDYDAIVDPDTLSYKYNMNDIYSNSWNTGGSGDKMTDPRPMMHQSIFSGITKGREGKGSVYVFSSGNGKKKGDNCGFDSHVNSIYTIAVGAILNNDTTTRYSEGCSSLMVVTYGGDKHSKKIATALPNGQCTDSFTGTSASAPMVAGVVALLLQARPDLTWRDVQHMLIQSAVPIDVDNWTWSSTFSQRLFSNIYGFGKVDALKSLTFAKSHQLVTKQIRITKGPYNVDRRISDSGRTMTLETNFPQTNDIAFLEHVTVTLDISHKRRREIEVDLVSPNGIVSNLIESRYLDESDHGFNEFTVMSLKHWDEPPSGKWSLEVRDVYPNNSKRGRLNSWSINFYGRALSTNTTNQL